MRDSVKQKESITGAVIFFHCRAHQAEVCSISTTSCLSVRDFLMFRIPATKYFAVPFFFCCLFLKLYYFGCKAAALKIITMNLMIKCYIKLKGTAVIFFFSSLHSNINYYYCYCFYRPKYLRFLIGNKLYWQ